MRGEVDSQSATFYYVSVDSRIPADHPLRRVKKLAELALLVLSRSSTAFTPGPPSRVSSAWMMNEPPKSGDGTGMVGFKGEKRANAIHQCTTDSEAKFMRKGNG